VRVVPDISGWEIAARLLVAAALTGAIGLERELRERTAGLRTHMLVGVGAALFTLVSAYAWGDFVFDRTRGTAFDPTRIAAQIVTGIGFLGAGAIIRQGLSVRGLTTAAGLWVVAAIGTAAGAGFYVAALVTTGIVVVALGPFRWLEGWLSRLRHEGRAFDISLRPGQSITPVLEVLDRRRVRVTQFEVDDEDDGRRARVELDLPFGHGASDLVDDLSALEGVTGVRWTG
jgi:putative Mg2+ transporter-C (MgtC) family protein